jgi:uncharacterized protein with HEPN domain
MWESNLELVRHIFDECKFIITHTQGKTENQILDDKVLLKALERSIEIIGEATKKIDDEFKSIHPHIEWRKMAGTRDHLIHHYFGVDYDILLDIIENKIPELYRSIKAILEESQ